ncbi:hypothetical protein SAMN02745751_00496 [Dethiosulfatibacter aminovorans DSM 17477]|uniref:Uncharacterized protein n=1 Tax=Dethiosulfatibacter aminovorans DSM 17477 TaxID=1121476 RepID=A0A1M6BWK8_9FIRM|nr:DUF2161 family putative PD-(D/E)XK-type phosphodiesterase [Dethiosulfatibacter aminovorans]SHI53013.1 hypothetical protein SAMN02745751_00496 [Dethiosulfatibacter aminovorans DSM 17477]
MKETELYQPVKDLFEGMGYEVYSEVDDMDVVAVKDDRKIVIELKTSLSMKLLIQAVKRQKIYEDVYVAVPFPKFKKRFSKDFKDKEYLLRRLELGLIFVSFNEKNAYAQIALEPKPFNLQISRTRSKKKRTLVDRELSNRHGDNNTGGTKGKLVTAYREKALELASYLRETDEMTTGELREASGNEKSTNILYKNYYGWFERADKGVYRLSNKGRSEVENYNHIIDKIRSKED